MRAISCNSPARYLCELVSVDKTQLSWLHCRLLIYYIEFNQGSFGWFIDEINIEITAQNPDHTRNIIWEPLTEWRSISGN